MEVGPKKILVIKRRTLAGSNPHSGILVLKFALTVRKASPFGIMGATWWLPLPPSVRTRDRGFGGKPPSGFSLIPAS